MTDNHTYSLKVGDRLVIDSAEFKALKDEDYFQKGQYIEINNPIHISFEVERHSFAGIHTCNIKVYGLRRANRQYLFRDFLDAAAYRPIELRIGGVLLFSGNMRECQSRREGDEVITEMTCWDGGYSVENKKSSYYFNAGTNAFEMINSLASNSVGIRKIVAGKCISGSQTKGTPQSKGQRRLFGDPMYLIRSFFAEGAYVEDGTLYLLGADELPPNSTVWLISAETGMIGSPNLGRTTIEADIIFNPQMRMCDIVDIQSYTQPWINGARVITGLKHTYESPYGSKAPLNKTHISGYRLLTNPIKVATTEEV